MVESYITAPSYDETGQRICTKVGRKAMFKRLLLARTPCYGHCPVYEVEVMQSGEVKYCGRDFVTEIGERRWRISAQKVRQLEDLIEWFDIQHFRYEAYGSATDLPSCVITLELPDGTIHEIHHNYGDNLTEDVARRLNRLENRIESILGTKKYVRPPFYIYRAEYCGAKPTIYSELVVVARNVQEAVQVANMHTFHEGALERQDWRVQKVGRETQGCYQPYVVSPSVHGPWMR
jgi:Domain of unknown function (DUF6438)